ncbi:MAG: uracil-DNA glycosylase [Phycisphaerae bacterium]
MRHLPLAAEALAVPPPQRAAAARVFPQPSPPRDTAQPTQLVAAQPARIFADSPFLPPIETRNLPRAEAQAALDALNETFVRGCTLCRLHENRTQTVFGVGNARAELMFVGEGPGADEDRQGEPFVGKAGQLLTRMIAAMTLTRDQVYICNVVKCRPPGNRTPLAEEMETCSPYLLRQIAIVRPKIIVSLGRPASQTLLATETPISRLRGNFHDFPPPSLQLSGVPTCKLMPTFHPAYLLRSPNEKGKAWSDLQDVMRFLGIPVPGRGT